MSSRSRWLVFLISTPIVLFVTVGGLLGAPKPSAQDFPNRPVADADLPTSRSMIFVTPDGERSMNTYLGISADVSPADVPA